MTVEFFWQQFIFGLLMSCIAGISVSIYLLFGWIKEKRNGK